jgi:tryptophan synthase beta chain
VGPEHSFLKTLKRAEYVSATDQEAADAFLALSKEEGILPALESSHAVAYAMKLAKQIRKDEAIVVTLSGRGDKDVETIAEYLGVKI